MFVYSTFILTLEKLLLSCTVTTQQGFLFFQKKKRIIVTTRQIVNCNEKGPQANHGNRKEKIAGHVSYFRELKGITKSLIKGQTNFILHYEGTPSIEMFCEQREELMEVIQQMYWIEMSKGNKDCLKLNIYGISQKSLTEFCNSEKDIIRGLNRMPGSYFLMNNTKENGDEELDDMEIDDFDEFVIIERDDIH